MPHFTDITGLSGVASVLTALVVKLLPLRSLPLRALALTTAIFFLVLLVPIHGLPIAGYVRGFTGDMSMTTLVLVWISLLRPYCHCESTPYSAGLYLFVIAAALFLYPMALGMTLFDPYRLGYGSQLFVVILLMIAFVSWLANTYLITLSIGLGMLVWSVGWYESTNLWDYLIDPFVAIYASGSLVGLLISKQRKAT